MGPRHPSRAIISHQRQTTEAAAKEWVNEPLKKTRTTDHPKAIGILDKSSSAARFYACDHQRCSWIKSVAGWLVCLEMDG